MAEPADFDRCAPPGYWAAMLAAVAALTAGYLCVAFAQIGLPSSATRWVGVYMRAQEACAAKCSGRKVVYVSGSSGLYGIHARVMTARCRLPVVNFGIHAGLGRRFLLDRAMRALRPGDVVVVGFEYELYEHPRFPEFACDYVMARDADYFRGLPLTERLRIILAAGPQRIAVGYLAPMFYGPEHFAEEDVGARIDEYGDLVPGPRHIDPSRRCPPLSSLLPLDPAASARADIARFTSWCEVNGIECVVVYPPFCSSDRERIATDAVPRVASERIEAAVRAAWAARSVAVLGRVVESVYACDDALDTHYHLNSLAAERHSIRIGDDVNDCLKGRP